MSTTEKAEQPDAIVDVIYDGCEKVPARWKLEVFRKDYPGWIYFSESFPSDADALKAGINHLANPHPFKNEALNKLLSPIASDNSRIDILNLRRAYDLHYGTRYAFFRKTA